MDLTQIATSLRHDIDYALNSTAAGPLAGWLTGLWGIVRVTSPVVREWIASRRNPAADDQHSAVTFQSAFELVAQRLMHEQDEWDAKESRYLARIEYLESCLREAGIHI